MWMNCHWRGWGEGEKGGVEGERWGGDREREREREGERGRGGERERDGIQFNWGVLKFIDVISNYNENKAVYTIHGISPS